MSERFHVDCALRIGPVVIDGPEAHHLATVCRLRVGAALCLFNGDGHQYPARVTAVDKRSVTVEVESVESPPRENLFRVEIAAPLPKGDRAQFMIEKLAELGVTRFVPLKTARSVSHVKEEKMRRWIIEASKQCGRNVLMEVEPLIAWDDYCRRADLPATRVVAHLASGAALAPRESGDSAAAVGPEGGFTDAEIDVAQEAGWHVISLGPRVLRVETAALALACRAAP